MPARGQKLVAKWRPIHIVTVYRLTKMGMTDVEIVKVLGVSRKTYWTWQQDHPEMKEAIAQAMKEREDTSSFPDWVYSRLSPEMKALWDRIESWGAEGAAGLARIEGMLQDHGVRARQQLFLHALCMCNFNPSHALAKVNVTKRELDRWLSGDPGFAELVEETDWHKGNFFEDSLVGLVKEGNPAAVLFANKTYNSDRGYGRRDVVDVNVSGQVLHGVLDLAELVPMLSEAARLEVLQAIRRREMASSAHRPPTAHERLEAEVLGTAAE